MGFQYDAHIVAAEVQVEILRDREHRANMQLGQERTQAAANTQAIREQARTQLGQEKTQAAANIHAIREQARSTERRSQEVVNQVQAAAEARVQ